MNSKTSKKKCSKYYGDNSWDIDFKAVEECELMDSMEAPVVVLSFEVYSKIRALMAKLKHTEWMGYFIGEQRENDIYVEDIVIPEQEATSASVTNGESHEGAIGIVHSHHRMGSFHSGKDDDGIIHQYPCSVVVDSDLDYDAKVKVRLPCGECGVIESDVVLDIPDEDMVDWAEEQMEDINRKTRSKKGKYRSRQYPYTGLYGRSEDDDDDNELVWSPRKDGYSN